MLEIVTLLAGIAGIITFIISPKSKGKDEKSKMVHNNSDIAVENNSGTINYNNYPEKQDESISLISEELLDLSHAGVYPVSEEGMINKDNITYEGSSSSFLI